MILIQMCVAACFAAPPNLPITQAPEKKTIEGAMRQCQEAYNRMTDDQKNSDWGRFLAAKIQYLARNIDCDTATLPELARRQLTAEVMQIRSTNVTELSQRMLGV